MSKLASKVYEALKTIPKGRLTTYKLLAHAVNSKAYRAVGQILKNNPNAPIVPCHRVVCSDGSLGGFMGSKANKEVQKKIKLLRSEGINIKDNNVLNFNSIKMSPKTTQ